MRWPKCRCVLEIRISITHPRAHGMIMQEIKKNKKKKKQMLSGDQNVLCLQGKIFHWDKGSTGNVCSCSVQWKAAFNA